MTVDAPTHVGAFRNYLFFSFAARRNSQASARRTSGRVIPAPASSRWATTSPASWCCPRRDRTTRGLRHLHALPDQHPLRHLVVELGARALPRTSSAPSPTRSQNVGYPMFLRTAASRPPAHAGVRQLPAQRDQLDVNTFMQEHKTLAVASCICRDKSQYRLFFTDKFALYITAVGQKVLGIMPILFNDVVRCAYSGRTERRFGGDALRLRQRLRLPDGPRHELRWGGDRLVLRHALPLLEVAAHEQALRARRFEITGTLRRVQLQLHARLRIWRPRHEPPRDAASSFSAGRWDTGTWDVGFWDGKTLLPSTFDLSGSGENIHLRIAGSSRLLRFAFVLPRRHPDSHQSPAVEEINP
jgi:hypothetical protein